jgi:hypothetical protein
MIEARPAVDVESAVRQWCRDRGFTTFFGTNNNGAFPQVIVRRISGPDDDCLIQFDVWADQGGGKKQAADEAARLATELSGLSSYDHDGVRLYDADWLSTRWLPDPTSDRPRYIVEATLFATAV